MNDMDNISEHIFAQEYILGFRREFEQLLLKNHEAVTKFRETSQGPQKRIMLLFTTGIFLPGR